MGILNWLFGSTVGSVDHDGVAPPDINPATGLPMLDGCVDVMGNPYGFESPGGMMGADHFEDPCHGAGVPIGNPFDDF